MKNTITLDFYNLNGTEYVIRPVNYFLTVKKNYDFRFGGDLALHLKKANAKGDNQILFFHINNKLEFMTVRDTDCSDAMITNMSIYESITDNKLKTNKIRYDVISKATKIIKRFNLESKRYEVIKVPNTNALFRILI